MQGCLAPFRGMEASVPAKGNPVKDGCKGMVLGKDIHMHEHPEGNHVSDHVALLWDGHIIFQHCEDDQDEIELGGFWWEEPSASEDLACHGDVLLDHVGSHSGADDCVPMDEGDHVAGIRKFCILVDLSCDLGSVGCAWGKRHKNVPVWQG